MQEQHDFQYSLIAKELSLNMHSTVRTAQIGKQCYRSKVDRY